MSMCWRGTLAYCSCASGSAIPQSMPLPQVPVGVLYLGNLCLLSRMIRALHAFNPLTVGALRRPLNKKSPQNAIFLAHLEKKVYLCRQNKKPTKLWHLLRYIFKIALSLSLPLTKKTISLSQIWHIANCKSILSSSG